jgi:hypothetical protein
MLGFITRRPLWVNVLFALGLIIIVFVLAVLSLNWITKHGEARNVPAVVGKDVNEVRKMLDDKGFALIVQDSIYYDSLPPGVVIRQVPEADEVVKVNRTVYVTINRYVPPDVDMPNLVGFSLRNAQMVLNNLGLKVGDTTYKPDFAKNSVLEQLFNGSPIKAGQKIKVGSSIALVLGSGLGSEQILVPSLRGMTFEEAKAMIDAQGLILGSVLPDPDVLDTMNAYVREQRPAPRTEDGRPQRIRPGQMIDLFLSLKPPAPDSTVQHTPNTTPQSQ